MFRASLCTLSSSLFRRSSATKIYIYISLLRLRAFCFRFPPPSPPTARAFFRGFFRGRIDTNCKTLSATVLPTTTCRSETIVETAAVFPRPRCRRRRFCSFILGNSGPSWPRFRVMFVCSFARSPSSRIVESILRKFSRRRGIWRIFF